MIVMRPHQTGGVTDQDIMSLPEFLKSGQQNFRFFAEDQFVFITIKKGESKLLFQPGD